MNRSGTLMLVAAAALAALALLLANPFGDSVGRDNPVAADLFGGGEVLGADRVEILVPGEDPVELALGAEGWVVASRDDFPADSAAVGALLRAVAGARSTGPASTNPDNHAKFQVDSTGVAVQVRQGGESLASFVLGKTGRDFTTSYVRPAGGEQVHVVRGLNRNLFARPRGFRNAGVMRFDPATARGVVLSGAGDSWELARTDSTWVRSRAGEEPAAAAEAVVLDLLETLGRLDADGFADDPDTLDTGLTDPEAVISVRFEDGSEAELRIGRDNGRNQRYAVRPGRRVLYLLAQWRVDRLLRSYEDLAGPA